MISVKLSLNAFLLMIYFALLPAFTAPTLGALLSQLYPVHSSWYNIGLQLGIPYSTLDCFKQMYFDPSDLMCEMLKHWLRTAVKPRPSCEAVVTALRSSLVNENYLADKLESKYCTPVQPMREESSSHTKMEKGEGIVITTLFCNFGFSL